MFKNKSVWLWVGVGSHTTLAKYLDEMEIKVKIIDMIGNVALS